VSEIRVPASLRARRKPLSATASRQLTEALRDKYFLDPPHYLETPEGERDLRDHVEGRISRDRAVIVPWLDSIIGLHGKVIVEVGCGTGSSTVALAEQGAFDIDRPSLEVGRERCKAYGVAAELHEGNAQALPTGVIGSADVVIFFASLEHMTLSEKLAALRSTWTNLKPGALLSVVETPNRLWWFDGHTSLLPFYLWLPDDLAIHYAKYSPRSPFNTQIAEPITNEKLTHLTRIGRCASYHEFELSIGDLRSLEVHSLNAWLRKNPIEYARWMITEAAYERQLRRLGPKLSPAFFEHQIQLAIRKPSR
jgi:S-adenosylmethionine-dependent methyltransferase